MTYRNSPIAFCTILAAWLMAAAAMPASGADWTKAHWLWDKVDTEGAPAESVFLRKSFELDARPRKGILSVTADNRYIVYLNGEKVGTGDTWQKADEYDVTKLLIAGKNTIAIQAKNEGGPAGVIAALSVQRQAGAALLVATDATWKLETTEAKNWLAADFDDVKWKKPAVLGDASIGPWNLTAGAGGKAPDGGNVSDRKITSYRPASEQASQFILPEGFKIELIAADPLVINPVCITLDEKGTLYVSESHTYRFGKSGSPVKVPSNPIVRLDRKPDGSLQRTVVAEGFDDPVMGMAIRNGQLWASANEHLFRFDLTDAGPAINKTQIAKDKNKAWNPFGNFVLEWGLDGLLYMSIGDHNIELVGKNNTVSGRGRSGIVVRMKPDGSDIERVLHGFRVPYSFEYDPFGQMWLLSNGEGNPNRFAKVIDYVDYHCYSRGAADNDWLAGNHPLAPPAFQLPNGAHTQLLRYYGSNFPQSYVGSLFLDNWGQHGFPAGNRAVFRYVPDERGNITTKEMFLQCKDPHFRCSHVLLAPDGSMLISDWYGRDDESDLTGRIWKVTYTGDAHGPAPKVSHTLDSPKWSEDAYALSALGSPHHLIREKASDVLVKRGAAAVAHLGDVAAKGDALGAVHALWALVRIGTQAEPNAAAIDAIARGADNADWKVRRLALRLSRRYNASGMAALAAMKVSDSDPAVRLESAISLGESAKTRDALAALLATDAADDAHLRYEAAWHLAHHASDQTIAALLHSKKAESQLAGLLTIDIALYEKTPAAPAALTALAAAFEAPGDLDVDHLITVVRMNPSPEIAPAMLKLAQREDVPAAVSAKAMLAMRNLPNRPALNVTAPLAKRFLEAVRTGAVKLKSPGEVTLFIELLEIEGPSDEAIAQLRTRVTDNQAEVRQAALNLATKFGPKAAPLADTLWPRVLDEKAKTGANDRLPLLATLSAIEAAPAADKWKSLLTHPNPDVARDGLRSWRRFAGDSAMTDTLVQAAPRIAELNPALVDDLSAVLAALAVDAAKVAANPPIKPFKLADVETRRAAALAFKPTAGSAALGRRVFERAGCVKCHTAMDQNTLRAPSLKGIGKAQTPQYLVESILEPSKIIKTGFEVERIETKDGDTHIALVQDKGDALRVITADQDFALAKSKIESRAVQKLSLMPVGLTDNLSQDELNDLVAYLRSLQ